MWFISPPVPQHKEWGVLLTLCMAQSQPTTAAQVGRRNTLSPWEISRQELLKPCLSSPEFPVHTLKFCSLLKVSPENLTSAAVGECQNWAQRGGESLKAKWELPSRRKAPFPLQQNSQVPEVLWGPPGPRAVACLVWGTISAQQNYLNTNIQTYWAEGTETRGQGPVSYWSCQLLACIQTISSKWIKACFSSLCF